MNSKFPTLATLEIESDQLVIYSQDYLSEDSNPPIGCNVQMLDGEGNVIWTVNGMSSDNYWRQGVDVFVGFRRLNGAIQLTSFSGNSYDLDLRTGKITFFEFQK